MIKTFLKVYALTYYTNYIIIEHHLRVYFIIEAKT